MTDENAGQHRAILYLRVSTAEQASEGKTSLTSQLLACEKKARDLNVPVVATQSIRTLASAAAS